MTGVVLSLMDSAFDSILEILCLIVLIGVVIMVIDRFVLKSRFSMKLFHREKPTIEKTPNVITEITDIAQLVCMTYYEEQLGIMERRDDGKIYFVDYKEGADNDNDCMVVQYNGMVNVGIDLKKIKQNDIERSGDNIKQVRIPKSEIIGDIVINPDDKIYIYKKGDWDTEMERKLYCHMKEELYKHALAEDIIKRSDEIAIKSLSNWFNAFGFKDVNVYMEETTEVKNS
jgi:hypothetical protein